MVSRRRTRSIPRRNRDSLSAHPREFFIPVIFPFRAFVLLRHVSRAPTRVGAWTLCFAALLTLTVRSQPKDAAGDVRVNVFGGQIGGVVTTTTTPAWWTTRSVLDPSKPPSDYAAANQGQAKNLARKAFDELEQRLPGGAGPVLTQLIAAWGNSASAADFAVINVGQLKALAKPFYDRLAESGYHGRPLQPNQTYPWSAPNADDADYAAANLGQLKFLFSFEP